MNKSDWIDNLVSEIDNLFNMGELKSLCFDLNIDLENIKGEIRITKIHSLIIDLGKANRLDELISLLWMYRPYGNWPDEVIDFFSIDYFSESDPNKRNLIDNMRVFWINKMNQQFESGIKYLDLDYEEVPDAIDPPWSLGLEQYPTPSKSIFGKSIFELFMEAGGALLILGDEGMGKTVALVKLAEDLMKFEEKNRDWPIPIILNLGRWDNKYNSIASWMVEEISSYYSVDKEFTETGLATTGFHILLDGLDEIPYKYRSKCINFINQFRADPNYSKTKIVVCCRKTEYFRQTLKLELNKAIQIKPLSLGQAYDFLKIKNDEFSRILNTFNNDEEFKDFIASPLNLSVLANILIDENTLNTWNTFTYEEKINLIFSLYVDHMFVRRNNDSDFNYNYTIKMLAWLASQMNSRGSNEFYIENLQPDWLLTQNQKNWFFLCSGLLDGIVVGAFAMVIFTIAFGLPMGIAAGLIIGIIIGIVEGLSSSPFQISLIENINWEWSRAFRGFVLGQVGKLLTSIKIDHAEKLTFGFRDEVRRSILSGFVLGAILGFRTRPLDKKKLETYNNPEEGVWRSAENALQKAALMGVALTFLVILFLKEALSGIILGMYFGTALFLIFGGKAFIQNFILQSMISKSHYLPWKLMPFLEYGKFLSILKGERNHYKFIFPALQDYFADLEIYSERQ